VLVTARVGERRGVMQELVITSVLAKPFRSRQFLDLIADITTETAERADRGRQFVAIGIDDNPDTGPTATS
jgi:hypothetical protein